MNDRAKQAAYGRRQRFMPLARKAAYVALSRRSVARALLQGQPTDELTPAPDADVLRIRPRVRTSEELSDIAARVNWFLPDIRIPIAIDHDPGLEIDPRHAPWMDPELVRHPGWREGPHEGRAHELMHRIGPREATAVMSKGRRSIVADPSFYYVADHGWIWLRWFFASMAWHSSQAATDRLFALGGPGSTAFVLATGPSARLVDAAAVTADVRISCNSVVRDRDLLQALRPNVVCFGDAVFHYGPSRYAAAFRRDLLAAVDDTDATLVTTEPCAGLLLAHHPHLAERLVILRLGRDKRRWRWPTRQDATVRVTGNILTVAMLPIAFALSDRIEIAGCDGRRSTERYFWKHNASTQYSDALMQTAFAAHPAFFRDRDYGDYYNHHCAELEDFLATAEAAGKECVGVTPTHIPALRRRGAPAIDG